MVSVIGYKYKAGYKNVYKSSDVSIRPAIKMCIKDHSAEESPESTVGRGQLTSYPLLVSSF
jgi:hypothetical protein